MTKVSWKQESSVTVRVRDGGEPVILLAHGAGTNQDHPLVAGLADALAESGTTCVTFNYPYSEAGRRRPDSHRVLVNCHRAVSEWVRSRHPGPFVLAGRSMGGRIATHLAADGQAADALVLYAYPLHPAGRPEKLRFDHLPVIEAPMLFFQGTRDALSRAEVFDRLVRPLPSVSVFDLEGADHSARIKGSTREEVNDLLAWETLSWLEALFADRR